MKHPVTRRLAALGMALLTLWAVAATVGSKSLPEALQAIRSGSLPRQLIRWELGDVFSRRRLSLPTMLTLYQSPMLMMRDISPAPSADADNTQAPQTPAPEKELPTDGPAQAENSTPQDSGDKKTPPPSAPVTPQGDLTAGLAFADNGVAAETVAPTAAGSYTVVDGVYLKNSAEADIDVDALSGGGFSAVYHSGEAPQVLILHTHGSEAYTMPPGQSYPVTGSYRTDDTTCNVVRIGDEIAAVLSTYGISVLHDRTLHDVPDYNEAYSSSADSAVAYLEKYPSLTYILDIHRDAIADADGNQYKVVTQEDSRAAQLSFIMGASHDNWEDNLRLAIAVQQTLQRLSPTLVRPITLRTSNYNQSLCTGSILVEVGAAGNSLDEAIYAGRLFAKGFAETILPTETQEN